MRQLLGKSRFTSRNVTEEVYLSEHVYCQRARSPCQWELRWSQLDDGNLKK